ncbi:hypothetical protein BC941DRAFT_14875 [Chlamydoabsidia padenii]|nr:hypothetical protein BC941DRAFT_14875 [Chlamydoabsidia padenii]
MYSWNQHDDESRVRSFLWRDLCGLACSNGCHSSWPRLSVSFITLPWMSDCSKNTIRLVFITFMYCDTHLFLILLVNRYFFMNKADILLLYHHPLLYLSTFYSCLCLCDDIFFLHILASLISMIFRFIPRIIMYLT